LLPFLGARLTIFRLSCAGQTPGLKMQVVSVQEEVPTRMHELSIAYSLVRVATEAVQEAQIPQVSAVHLRLGVLSGVVKESLLFSYDIATENTPLAGSQLIIEELPIIIFCPTCNAEQTLPGIQSFRCPVCGQPSAQIVQGKELQIVSLEVADAAAFA